MVTKWAGGLSKVWENHNQTTSNEQSKCVYYIFPVSSATKSIQKTAKFAMGLIQLYNDLTTVSSQKVMVRQ